MRNIKRIVIHHTASGRDVTTLEMIDAWHKVRWPGFQSSLGFWCGYHYVIGKDWMTQTRSDQEDGAHTYGFNGDSIGICLTGNFTNEQPNQYQLDQLRHLVLSLLGKYNLSEKDIYLHRELTATACPGKNFTRELLHNTLAIAASPAISEDKKKLESLITEITAILSKYK